MYFVQLEFFAIIMVNAKEFLIFRVSLDNQTEPQYQTLDVYMVLSRVRLWISMLI